jgi:hypothetical protein
MTYGNMREKREKKEREGEVSLLPRVCSKRERKEDKGK